MLNIAWGWNPGVSAMFTATHIVVSWMPGSYAVAGKVSLQSYVDCLTKKKKEQFY
jgi:hypothetical protein